MSAVARGRSLSCGVGKRESLRHRLAPRATTGLGDAVETVRRVVRLAGVVGTVGPKVCVHEVSQDAI